MRRLPPIKDYWYFRLGRVARKRHTTRYAIVMEAIKAYFEIPKNVEDGRFPEEDDDE